MERARPIRINLLQSHEEKGLRKHVPLIIIILLLAIIGTGLGYLVTLTRQELMVLRKANAELEIEAANYKLEQSWINKAQSGIEERGNIRRQVEKQKISCVEVMDEIKKNIPWNIVLTGIDIEDGKVLMNGYAPEHYDVACFLSGLRQSSLFKDVLLTSSELNENSNEVEFTVENSWEAKRK